MVEEEPVEEQMDIDSICLTSDSLVMLWMAEAILPPVCPLVREEKDLLVMLGLVTFLSKYLSICNKFSVCRLMGNLTSCRCVQTTSRH